MPVNKWENISCSCGSDLFFEVFTYQVHPHHGTTKGNEEYRCLKCRKSMNPAAQREALAVRRKMQELRELGVTEESIKAAEAAMLSKAH